MKYRELMETEANAVEGLYEKFKAKLKWVDNGCDSHPESQLLFIFCPLPSVSEFIHTLESNLELIQKIYNIYS
jgi:hypothetical protein